MHEQDCFQTKLNMKVHSRSTPSTVVRNGHSVPQTWPWYDIGWREPLVVIWSRLLLKAIAT